MGLRLRKDLARRLGSGSVGLGHEVIRIEMDSGFEAQLGKFQVEIRVRIRVRDVKCKERKRKRGSTEARGPWGRWRPGG